MSATISLKLKKCYYCENLIEGSVSKQVSFPKDYSVLKKILPLCSDCLKLTDEVTTALDSFFDEDNLNIENNYLDGLSDKEKERHHMFFEMLSMAHYKDSLNENSEGKPKLRFSDLRFEDAEYEEYFEGYYEQTMFPEIGTKHFEKSVRNKNRTIWDERQSPSYRYMFIYEINWIAVKILIFEAIAIEAIWQLEN